MQLNVLEGVTRTRFEASLPHLLKSQRWFGGKARDIAAAHITDAIVMPSPHRQTVFLFIDVAYRDGGHESYVLPIASAFGEDASRVAHDMPRAVLAHLTADEGDRQQGILYDATWDPTAMHTLLRAMDDGIRLAGETGALQASSTTAYTSMVPPDGRLASRVLNAEQSNTSVVFGEQAIVKLYRRVQPGINPDWEIGRYLTTHAFPYSPAVGAAIEYVRSGETTTVAVLQAFVRNQGDAWSAMLKQLDGYLIRVRAELPRVDDEARQDLSVWDLAQLPPSEAGRELLGPAVETAVCLARRTAALHLTLGQSQDDADFALEPMTLEYRRSRQQSMVKLWKQVVHVLRQRPLQGAALQQDVHELLTQEARVLDVFRTLLDIHQGGQRIRCHGDYHLGQVLCTGSDYIVTDFEGEPARPLDERRMKHSPLYDVAGMLRSFDYASWTALVQCQSKDRAMLEPWLRYWSRCVRGHFLGQYVAEVQTAPF